MGYNERTPERREYERKWSKSKKRREYMKKYYHNNREKIRKKMAARIKFWKKAVFDKLGNECSKCGVDDERCLQIDHVNGGGGKEWAILRSRTKLYKKVLEDTEGMYQTLCANCNWIKRYENDEWPHRKK